MNGSGTGAHADDRTLSAANGQRASKRRWELFGLLLGFLGGAIIVDTQTRITWMDTRYRELLKLAPDFDHIGLSDAAAFIARDQVLSSGSYIFSDSRLVLGTE